MTHGFFPCLSCRALPGQEHRRVICNLGPGAALRRQRIVWTYHLWLEMPREILFRSWINGEARPIALADDVETAP